MTSQHTQEQITGDYGKHFNAFRITPFFFLEKINFFYVIFVFSLFLFQFYIWVYFSLYVHMKRYACLYVTRSSQKKGPIFEPGKNIHI